MKMMRKKSGFVHLLALLFEGMFHWDHKGFWWCLNSIRLINHTILSISTQIFDHHIARGQSIARPKKMTDFSRYFDAQTNYYRNPWNDASDVDFCGCTNRDRFIEDCYDLNWVESLKGLMFILRFGKTKQNYGEMRKMSLSKRICNRPIKWLP